MLRVVYRWKMYFFVNMHVKVSLGCIGICIEATDREAWHRKSRRQRVRVCWWSEKGYDEVKKRVNPTLCCPIWSKTPHGRNPDWWWRTYTGMYSIPIDRSSTPKWDEQAMPTPRFGSLIMAPIISIKKNHGSHQPHFLAKWRCRRWWSNHLR